MKTIQLNSIYLCVAALCVALTLTAALAIDVFAGPIAIHWKIGSVAIGLTAVGLLGACIYTVSSKRQTAIAQFLDQLCQSQPQTFGGDLEQLLPNAPDAGQLEASLQQLRKYIIHVGQACQQAESDRARAEIRHRKAQAQCDQFHEILEGVTEPVLAIDQFDELVVANESASQLFQFVDDDLEARTLNTLVECEELVALLRDARRRGAGRRAAEVSVADSLGQQRWFNATVSTISHSQEAAVGQHGAVAVLRDISDQKEIQRRHAEFVSSVSHEMKTPLSSIKAYVELLADGDAEDEATREEFLEVINGQADRLRRLIDNLLNLARIEAGVVSVSKEKQSLNDILEEAFQVVQPAAETRSIQFNSELSPMYMGVFVDRDMILQSAINLLSNAVKYTPAGGAVTIRSRACENEVLFEVEDTGVGLSEEDCLRVFDKFYRVKANREMASGTGLGLPLAKHIVEEVHSGVLSLTSVPGQGSTFRVILPLFDKS